MNTKHRLLAAGASVAGAAGLVLGGVNLMAAHADNPQTLGPWGQSQKAKVAPHAAADATGENAGPAVGNKISFVAQTTDFQVIDLGAKGDSPGDRVEFSERLVTGGKTIGFDTVECVLTYHGRSLCNGSFNLTGLGKITVDGNVPETDPKFTLPIVGGTGSAAFQVARGQALGEDLPNGDTRFTLYLQ